MWLLQPKNIHKRHLLWAKLFVLCFFLHVLFLGYVFILYQSATAIVSFSINKSCDYSIPIVFSCVPQPIEQCIDKSLSSKVVAQKREKKAPACTVSFSKKTIVPAKKPQDVVKKKEEPAKIIEAAKKIESIKKEINKKDETLPAPLIPIKKVNEALPVKKDIYTSSNHREVEALRCAAQLQKELVHYWHPPIGVSPDCTCEISFFVTSKGAIERLKMVKSSGVTLFDISARQALLGMKMPHWTYNKSLNIAFKQ